MISLDFAFFLLVVSLGFFAWLGYKESLKTKSIQPKQVQVILKVTPKDTVFDLSMIKPEVLNLAYSEKGEVQMMMDEGIQYQLQIQATNGQKELIEIQPSGQMEVHYIRF